MDGALLVGSPDGKVRVKSSSTAVVKNMHILKHILMDWKVWQTAPSNGIHCFVFEICVILLDKYLYRWIVI